jgi:hypothetical protein
MAGLVPAIYVFLSIFSIHEESKTWMPATSGGHDEEFLEPT